MLSWNQIIPIIPPLYVVVEPNYTYYPTLICCRGTKLYLLSHTYMLSWNQIIPIIPHLYAVVEPNYTYYPTLICCRGTKLYLLSHTVEPNYTYYPTLICCRGTKLYLLSHTYMLSWNQIIPIIPHLYVVVEASLIQTSN